MSNILTTKELGIYRQAILDEFVATPLGDGTSMLAIVDALELANKLDRYTQVVDNLKTTRNLNGNLQGGDLVVAVTVSTAGTGYSAGSTYPVTGVTGTGGTMKILTVDTGGEILTAEVSSVGSGYDTPVVDLTGAGDGLGVVALTANAITGNSEVQTLDDMLALI